MMDHPAELEVANERCSEAGAVLQLSDCVLNYCHSEPIYRRGICFWQQAQIPRAILQRFGMTIVNKYS
jgi:hypothetical protein